MSDNECTMKRMSRRLKRLSAHLFEMYCDIVMYHPWKVIAIGILIPSIISFIGIYFYSETFDFDPSKGFETRGTDLSESRLILESLKKHTASPTEILNSLISRQKRAAARVFRSGPTTAKSFIKKNALANYSATSTLEPISINYDDYGVDSEPKEEDLKDPCTQYMAMGKSIPYEYIDYFAKIIVEADSLFTLKTFRALCEIDDVINETAVEANYTSFALRLEHSFNLPYSSLCLNLTSRKTCDALNENDIIHLKNTINRCLAESTKTDDICRLEMVKQAIHYLLPLKYGNADSSLVAVILPIALSNGKSGLPFYKLLARNLGAHLKSKGLHLKGVYFNTKNSEFTDALKFDACVASVSAALVLTSFLVYSRSLLFTAIIFLIIFLSMGLSFFVYACLFSISFFPFINLLVLVLMIAIAADDAFLLLGYYRTERNALVGPWIPGDVYLPAGSAHARCLRLSLRHALSSMFITSATTAVAFLSNLYSDVIVLRCFGVYASLTVLFNFVLVAMILPSTVMITAKAYSPSTSKGSSLSYSITQLVVSIRYIAVVLAAALTTISIFIVFWYPGLQLPAYNPTKLLSSSQPSEWFDDNSHLFDFAWKRKAKLMEYYLIGDFSNKNEAHLSPYDKGLLTSKEFSPTYSQLKRLQDSTQHLVEGTEFANSTLWIDIFLNTNRSCLEDKPRVPSSCVHSACLDRLPASFPDDFTYSASDGPLFNKNFSLIGYFVSIPSSTVLSGDAPEIKRIFGQIERKCSTLKQELDGFPLKCMSSSDITRYYDIIERLKPSTYSSVAISVVVSLLVVILCTRRLLLSMVTVAVICSVILWITASLVLLGWKLSVVESTILVLTIGLAFDFSLHVASGLREGGDLRDNICSCFSSAGMACALAAAASVLCGAPLLFARTAAFSQVGVMLVALGVLSLIGACIALPSTLLVISPNAQKLVVVRF